MHGPPQLLVIMPVYNEEASVRKVVMEWFYEIENWTEDFVFLALDDGSTDRTPQLLARLREQLGARLEVVRHANRGHGQTCLEGYRIALTREAPFVLQIDSDGQCDPQYFCRLWRLRDKCDVVYGSRRAREDGLRRRCVSVVLKLTLLFTRGTWCEDANVPYRLMRTQVLAPSLREIPADFSLANIALATLLKENRAIRHGSVPIRFRERYGGEPHVPISRFGAKAFELIAQLRALPRS